MDIKKQIDELYFLRNTLRKYTPEEVNTSVPLFAIATHIWATATELYSNTELTIEQHGSIKSGIIEPLYEKLQIPGFTVSPILEADPEGPARITATPRFSIDLLTIMDTYGKGRTRTETIDRLKRLLKKVVQTHKAVYGDRCEDADFWVLDCVVRSRDVSMPESYGAILHSRFEDPEWKTYINGYDSARNSYGCVNPYKNLKELLEDNIPH